MADRPAIAVSGPGGIDPPDAGYAGAGPGRAGVGVEIKFDGLRAIRYAGPSGLRVVSRNDRDISRSYPEVAGLRLSTGVVVDGELVALDERGRPDFALLQQRMHVTAPAPGLVALVPVQYVVFDLLRDGRDLLLDLPYEQRRTRLQDLVLGRVGVVVPQNFRDIPGVLVMTAAREQGLEGVVARRLTSVYQPGATVAGVGEDPHPAYGRGLRRWLVTHHRQPERARVAAAGRTRRHR
jgi:bifunctional non-homologous end joining protein LigD